MFPNPEWILLQIFPGSCIFYSFCTYYTSQFPKAFQCTTGIQGGMNVIQKVRSDQRSRMAGRVGLFVSRLCPVCMS